MGARRHHGACSNPQQFSPSLQMGDSGKSTFWSLFFQIMVLGTWPRYCLVMLLAIPYWARKLGRRFA